MILTDQSLIMLFVAGAAGSLVNDLVADNSLIIPKKLGDVINLGFIGSMIVGGFAGVAIDGSYLTAFMGGFMGKDIIVNLVNFQRKPLTKAEPEADDEIHYN